MEIDYLMHRERAIESLAGNLCDGTLVLFLGAGVSIGAGLPRWLALIESLRREVGLPDIALDSSAESLQLAADEVRRDFYSEDDRGFAELVRRCLYRDVPVLNDNVLGDRLLTALGALMMGSRRGSIKRVVNFNFDCMLEWYISLFGFVPQVILQPPADEGAEDVRIYHPHGYLPHDDLKIEGSDFVILGLKSINLRLGKPHDAWIVFLRHILSSGVGLFVGLSEDSFRDRALAPLLTATAEELTDRRHTGFWILSSEGPNAAKVNQEFLDCNIVPLRLKRHEDVPGLLFDICKRAAQTIKVSGAARKL